MNELCSSVDIQPKKYYVQPTKSLTVRSCYLEYLPSWRRNSSSHEWKSWSLYVWTPWGEIGTPWGIPPHFCWTEQAVRQIWKRWQTAQTPFAEINRICGNLGTKYTTKKGKFIFPQNSEHCERKKNLYILGNIAVIIANYRGFKFISRDFVWLWNDFCCCWLYRRFLAQLTTKHAFVMISSNLGFCTFRQKFK